MSILLHGDCLEEMKGIDDDSIDFIFCDLPYGQTSCKWDCKIDLQLFWEEIIRIKKLHTPIFHTTTTKFGVELINSAPKKCPFRYDLVWVKSAPAGFLSAKKMPMRKHEMVYVFYEKLPLYDLSSHTHKFIKEGKKIIKGENNTYNTEGRKKPIVREEAGKYDPPLPVSVVKEDCYDKDKTNDSLRAGHRNKKYDPPLPVSVIKENTGGATGKETKKYERKNSIYPNRSTNGETAKKYDPPLPVSVVKEDVYDAKERFKNGKLTKHPRHLQKGDDPIYEPPLPTSMVEIKSTRGKHSTEKPVALIEWLLKYYSKEGDTILDATMGSGSSGVACKNMNRNFIGIEKDPEIYEVAVNRIED